MHFPAESKVWESDGRRNSRLVDKEQEYCGQGSAEALSPPLSAFDIDRRGKREENDSVLLSGKRSEGIYPKRRRRKRRPKSFYCLAIAMAGGGNFHPGTINSCGETQNKKRNLAQKTQKEIL